MPFQITKCEISISDWYDLSLPALYLAFSGEHGGIAPTFLSSPFAFAFHPCNPHNLLNPRSALYLAFSGEHGGIAHTFLFFHLSSAFIGGHLWLLFYFTLLNPLSAATR